MSCGGLLEAIGYGNGEEHIVWNLAILWDMGYFGTLSPGETHSVRVGRGRGGKYMAASSLADRRKKLPEYLGETIDKARP
ncbi:hypothetical protein CEXT_491051 [Caerostris extrusa]|uniref:Uncharacterized protein n=1 Tax=Caerostris extrusa TaxID=172846 RepID=A0AAV4XZ32_CAEEX|nr:hypothetical protein CEXT_491051 [Caerostris extrusa]